MGLLEVAPGEEGGKRYAALTPPDPVRPRRAGARRHARIQRLRRRTPRRSRASAPRRTSTRPCASSATVLPSVVPRRRRDGEDQGSIRWPPTPASRPGDGATITSESATGRTAAPAPTARLRLLQARRRRPGRRSPSAPPAVPSTPRRALRRRGRARRVPRRRERAGRLDQPSYGQGPGRRHLLRDGRGLQQVRPSPRTRSTPAAARAGREGDYAARITVGPANVDYYAVRLKSGDVLGGVIQAVRRTSR